jgi:hypothetical protein
MNSDRRHLERGQGDLRALRSLTLRLSLRDCPLRPQESERRDESDQ